MKKTNIIIIIIALIAVVALLVYNNKDKQVAVDNGQTAPQTMCFLTELDTQAGKDYQYISATLAADGTTTGVFNLVPSEKDILKGPFTGTWKKDGAVTMLDVIHNYSAEGITANEARKIKISDAGASVGYGEVVEDNDVYVYKDESKITYTTVMPKIACDAVPVAAK